MTSPRFRKLQGSGTACYKIYLIWNSCMDVVTLSEVAVEGYCIEMMYGYVYIRLPTVIMQPVLGISS